MAAVLTFAFLYPMARIGERYFTEQTRLRFGIGVMTASLALMAMVKDTVGVFSVVALFYTGALIAEPARESLAARYARAAARASYMGLSKIGLALGGLIGYVAGGYLLDYARALHAPGLPWLVLSLIGCATLFGLARQFPRPAGSLFRWAPF